MRREEENKIYLKNILEIKLYSLENFCFRRILEIKLVPSYQNFENFGKKKYP